MFKKPFRVKSNNAIRGSERRKLRENVSKHFLGIEPDVLVTLVPNKEDMSVMKILTHNEVNVTCYCIKKNPMLFEIDGVLLPTVYALWSHSCLKLSFKTYPNVLPVIAGGADLMFPGVIPPTNGFPEFATKMACYVTLLGNGAAVAVGVTSCASKDIINDGLQGKRVTIYHSFKDHLWAAGDKTDLPLLPEVTILPQIVSDALVMGDSDAITVKDSNIVVSDNEALVAMDSSKETINNSEIVIPNSDVAVAEQLNEADCAKQCLEPINNFQGEGEQLECCDGETGRGRVGEGSQSLSPQEEMDELMENCFCQALLNAKNIELPILVSTFSSQYLHPICPDGQRIDVKKSSYKKMSKFLIEMQSRGLVEVKELSKGVESIITISLGNEEMRRYKSSQFAQMMKQMKQIKLNEDKQVAKLNNQNVEIRELFAVSAKTVPFFKIFNISKGVALSSTDVRKYITEYVKENELINQNNRKLINLDPLLTNVLFGKSNYEETLAWDGLISRMLDNMNPCHEVTVPGERPVIKKGEMDFIEVSIEQRMGNKKVTIIKNLESFGVNIKTFAQDLQQAAASSTAVNPVPGKNSSGHLVLVQGVQMKHVKHLLETNKIPKKFIKGLDTKDKKKSSTKQI